MSSKVAVIGAGIAGLQTGCFLAKAGHEVTIFEKQTLPPVNPSSLAGGMLAPFSELETFPMRFVRLGLQGIELWSRILGQEKATLLIKQTGSLLIAHASDIYMLERFAQNLKSLGQSWSWVTAAKIQALEPCLHGRFQKGIFIPNEAFLLPSLAFEMLLECFGSYGGKIVQAEMSPESLILDFDWVADCRGYVENLDSGLRGVLGEILIIRNKDIQLTRPVRLMHPRYPLYIVPRPENVFAIGATMVESAGEDDGLVMGRSAMELLSAAYSLHPSFADAKILHLHSAIRAAYPDNLPRLVINSDSRIMRCNGLFRHGYMLAPVIAHCIEQYISQGEITEDLSLFSGLSNQLLVLNH